MAKLFDKIEVLKELFETSLWLDIRSIVSRYIYERREGQDLHFKQMCIESSPHTLRVVPQFQKQRHQPVTTSLRHWLTICLDAHQGLTRNS